MIQVGSVHDQTKNTAKEKKLYEKLKALNRYHRRSGVEAILYRKSLERRAQVTMNVYTTITFSFRPDRNVCNGMNPRFR